jgi:hypothetical protein
MWTMNVKHMENGHSQSPSQHDRDITQATSSVRIQHSRPYRCPSPGLGARALGLGP